MDGTVFPEGDRCRARDRDGIEPHLGLTSAAHVPQQHRASRQGHELARIQVHGSNLSRGRGGVEESSTGSQVLSADNGRAGHPCRHFTQSRR